MGDVKPTPRSGLAGATFEGANSNGEVDTPVTIDGIVQKLQSLVAEEVDHRAIYDKIMDDKTPNTGQTFMAKEELQMWRNREIKVLWVTGGREYSSLKHNTLPGC